MKYLIKKTATNRTTGEQTAWYIGKGGNLDEEFAYLCTAYGYNRICDAQKGLKSQLELINWEKDFNKKAWNREPIWTYELEIIEFAELGEHSYTELGKAC